MIEAQIEEGALTLDDDRMIVVHNMRSGFLNFFIYSVLGRLFVIEDDIQLNDIIIVSVETGTPDIMCPHLYVRYEKKGEEKSRIIEFPMESKGKKCDINKVIDFLDKKRVQLGIMRSD
jgi:hypothetical protein